jgi:hypothetical protein
MCFRNGDVVERGPKMQALGFVLSKSPRRNSSLTHVEEAISGPSHRDAVRLLDRWSKLSASGGMVLGRHFPSRDFTALLPNVVLFEWAGAAREFRVRLAGFSMLCFHGLDITGKILSEFLSDAECADQASRLRSVQRSGAPHLTSGRSCLGGMTVLEHEAVSLPVLACDGVTPLVMTATFWSHGRWLH